LEKPPWEKGVPPNPNGPPKKPAQPYSRIITKSWERIKERISLSPGYIKGQKNCGFFSLAPKIRIKVPFASQKTQSSEKCAPKKGLELKEEKLKRSPKKNGEKKGRKERKNLKFEAHMPPN